MRDRAGCSARHRGAAALVCGALALLAGCASGPRQAPRGADGPSAVAPAELERLPDAVPRIETLRAGGPNKPYEVFGRGYTPETRDVPMREHGIASWYGRKFHGRKTASGETYDMHAMTAAHKTMPLPSYARVRNPKNGREIVVRVNDRGPFVAGRVIDLSYAAALRLGVADGVAPVEVERLTHADIRSGAWRRDAPAAPTPAPAPAPDSYVAGPTTAPQAEPVSATPPEPVVPPTAAAGDGGVTPAGFWVQLGAFRERDGALGFQQRVAAELDWLAPLMGVFSDAALFRLQAGPYASRDAAQDAALRVREALQLVPLVVERR